MAEQKKQPTTTHPNAKGTQQQNDIPKPESSSEYEGAPSRKPTGNLPVEKKTETSKSSGQ
jgi:hypothetical protein